MIVGTKKEGKGFSTLVTDHFWDANWGESVVRKREPHTGVFES